MACHDPHRPVHILGFNSTHDASAALVRDGEVICAVEEERLSRKKHHYGFPHLAIRACLNAGGIKARDLDHAAFYWDARKGLLPFLLHLVRHLPGSTAFLRRQPGIFRKFLGLPGRLRREYGFSGRFHFLSHHGNHIASAFWPSGLKTAAALSVDGTGEWETTVLGRIDERGHLNILDRLNYPHSLGKLWEAVTAHLGFRVNSGEGKVMGLAPYGRPDLRRAFSRVLRPAAHGLFRLNLDYFDFHLGRERKVSDLFVEHFGPPRVPESAIEPHHEDLAFALQTATEEALLRMARELHRRTGLPNLVMAGGVALNSVSNGRIRETPFANLFVQPSAGDAGAALGAALRVWHEVLGRGAAGRHRPGHSYLGPGFTDQEGVAALESRGLRYQRTSNAPAEAAERLARGEILGWFQGRMEYGPRALGNRSILADPRGPDIKDVVNARVKHREPFRPFAPAVIAEAAGDWFEMGLAEAPFMLKVFAVRRSKRDALPAITHVDGSARVQTVRREANPPFHALIKAFGDRTGVPVVLNTSFNVRGEPIVCTPEHAVDCFLGTGIDTLILGDLVVEKP